MDEFPFSTDVRVRFAETDAQGIAHHASFVVWLEVARVAHLARYAGGYQAIRERGVEALTTEVHVRYHRATYFDECSDGLGSLRRHPRITLRYEYRITRGDELVAEGYTQHATVDRETYRPTRVPVWLAEAVTVGSPAG